MGKYLDKTGLQYFYNKLKEKFADKTTIENKLNSLTGALTWKGELSALPATTNYTAGNVIKVGTKEYVLTENNGTKSWDELGDEGSYLLKTTAENTYLKKAAGEVKTANLADGSVTSAKIGSRQVTGGNINDGAITKIKIAANAIDTDRIVDGSVTKAKLDTSVQDSLGKADNSLQIGKEQTVSSSTTLSGDYSFNSKSSNGKYMAALNSGKLSVGGVSGPPIELSNDGTMNLLTFSTPKTGDILLRGTATPTNDNDAANKKYVDNKTSGTVKICQTNEPVSGHEQYTTLKVNAAGYGMLNIDATDMGGSVTTLSGNSVNVGSRSHEVATGITKNSISWGKLGDTYGSITVNSNNKLQITGLDTPTSDTDAANKAYVDTTVANKADKASLATSLQAITIYTDNTAEHKAANLANIKAYEDNLKSMGVNTVKDNHIPIAISDTIQKGFLVGNTSSNRYVGLLGQDNVWFVCVIANDGTYVPQPILTGTLSMLSTTSKASVINAINEVNALAKSKASTAVATQSANGLMSADDKKKLDGALAAIANNASVNAIDIVSYDEQSNTYTGNAINLNGNDIKTETAITVSGTTIAANTTMDDALKTILTVAKNAASDATYAKEHGVQEINGSYDSVVNFATSGSEPGDIEFNVTSNDGTTTDITGKVFGLGSAAYRDENAFATYSQGVAASTALQSITAGMDAYINATVEKKEGTSQQINVSASVSTDIGDTTTTGEYLADAYAVKQYVDSKVAGGSDMITLVYDDDSGYLTTINITDAQYKAITDAINANIKPNIQVAYFTGGEYNYIPLCYQFDEDYYFGSIYCDNTIIDYATLYVVNVTIDSASSNGKHAITFTFNSDSLQNIIARIAKRTNIGTSTISTTSGSQTLPNISGKYALTATSGSYTLNVPQYPNDGVTYEIYKYGVNSSLTISSPLTNMYVCDLASTVKNKTYSSRNGKITITYFAGQSKWVVMRTDFGQ